MILHAIFIGIIATCFMDLIAIVQRRLFDIPSLNYAMVGRWLGHIPKGRFIHRPTIGQSSSIPGESILGWTAHYVIGILFAAIFIVISDHQWTTMLGPIWPIMFGAVTVVVPFLLLQPGMGAGIAAHRTPSPWSARARSLMAHVTFGIGLWLGDLLLAQAGGN